MNAQSLVPILLLIMPFVLAFLIEALVIYFFKLYSFWRAIGFSFIINILTIGIMAFAVVPIIGKLGYTIDGLQSPPPVFVFLWWVSAVVDGFLLMLLPPRKKNQSVFIASILMNAVSYLFLYFFIVYSH